MFNDGLSILVTSGGITIVIILLVLIYRGDIKM